MALAHIEKEATEKKKQEWYMEQILPKGKLVLLAGESGIGKSALTAYLAKSLPKRYNIWFWLLEDDVQAYNNKIGVNDNIKYVQYKNNRGDYDTPTVQDIKRDILDNNLSVFVIDPIAFMMSGKDMNDNSKVRSFLMPLQQVAEETRCCIIGVHHFSKGSGRVKDMATGAHAWVATPRHVLSLVADKNSNLFLEVTKSNITHTGTSWKAIKEINEYCMTIKTLEDAESGSAQTAINSLYDNSKRKNPPVIENLKERFDLLAGFTLQDIDNCGNRKSFYNWIEKNSDKIQSRQEGRKKIYWFI